MLKSFIAVVLLAAFCVSAEAAPSASGKSVVGPTTGQDYWLSDGLNRLVFWKTPQKVPAEKPTR